MKFGKKLISYLFEIYPEASIINFDRMDCEDRYIADCYDLMGTRMGYVPCQPPTDGITDYKREDIFVAGVDFRKPQKEGIVEGPSFKQGDEVEIKHNDTCFGHISKWQLYTFIAYEDDGAVCRGGSKVVLAKEIRIPKRIKVEMLEEKAIELGLVEDFNAEENKQSNQG